MTHFVPQHWLLFAGPSDTGLAVKLEPVMSKKGVSLSFTPGQIGESLDIELTTNENDNSPSTDAYRALEDSAQNGGGCGYTLLQSEGHLRNEATFRFQFEKKYLKGDVLQNVSGASADLLFGLAVVTAVRDDLEYRPFAATGILSKDGQVQPIEGLRAKINAVLNIPALSGNGLIFYPKANDKDIDVELRHRVEQAQIDLKAVERLEEAVECLGIPIQGTWLGNPYRRLDVFEYSHRRIYFGREDEADYLAKKLFERAKLDRPNLLILGPSGGGKSSLVQAGLIPELEKRFKDHTLLLLFSVFDLRSAANKDVRAIAASIRSSWSLLPGLAGLAVNSSSKQNADITPPDIFAALVSDLISCLPDQTCFVWVLDQLEQFFTLGLSEEAEAAFIHFLRELQARGIWIVATFRNDFYSALQAHDGILSIFDKDATHDLEKLNETTIERIIQKPAELAKLEFEKDDQKSELLSLKLKNDALGGGKDILPLLEFALYQLYEKRELKNGRTQLTWAAYEAMGGLQGAIGNRADEVLHSLDQASQETLGRVLRTLAKLRRDSVQTESGKSPFIASVVNVEQFTSGTPARRLVDAFADARLFVLDRDNEGIAQVRVTHEALFTHWAKADKILKDSMKDMVVRERLADSEVHWKAKDEAVSLLLQPGLPLEEAEDLLARLGDELHPDIIHYIKQSVIADQERKQKESEAQRRKNRFVSITAVVLGILLIVATGAIYYVNQARNEQAAMLASAYFSEGARLVDEGRSKEALAYLAQASSLDSNADFAAGRFAASLLLSKSHYKSINTIRMPDSCYKVDSVQISPDGRRALISCGLTFVWDTLTGESTYLKVEHGSDFFSAQFSPDGRWVLTASFVAQVWDAANGKPVSLIMHNVIESAQFSPDGRWVVTASRDNTARVWDAATGKQMSEPMNHEDEVLSAQFSPDGRWVVTASRDNTVRVWDTATGMPVSKLMKHKDKVLSVQFSPDGRLVATTLSDYKFRIWDAMTGAPVPQLEKNDEKLQFSPDGRWVVTASRGMVTITRIATGESVRWPIESEDSVKSIQFTSNGRWLIATAFDETVSLLEIPTPDLLPSYEIQYGLGRRIGSSPDGHWVITANGDTAHIWNAATRVSIAQPMVHKKIIERPILGLDGHELRVVVLSAQFSSDGRWIATISSDDSVRVWHTATGKLVSAEPMVHKSKINSIQFSRNGRWVVTASGDTVRIWDVVTGALVSKPMVHRGFIETAEFSPNGRWVVTLSRHYGTQDQSAQVWEAGTGKPVQQSIKYGRFVYSAQFSPDERWIVIASSDKKARVFEVETGTPVSQTMQHGSIVWQARFSPDGRWIVTSSEDQTARVWDAATGAPVSQLMKHNDRVYSAEFSPDSRWIVTTSRDKKIRIWEAATGKPVSVPLELQGQTELTRFSPDGRRIMVGSNSYLEAWEIPCFPEIGRGFTEFLERVSGYVVNSKNTLQAKGKDSTIKELREWTAVSTELTQEERKFINWWLSDPIERTVTPTSKQTVKERIQMLIDHETIASLNEALDYYPGHPMALAKLAAATWRETKTDQQNDIRPRVALWTNLALKYAPDDTAVRAVAEKVLQDIAQPN
ncbi:MAG: hypothetical protein Q7T74_04845 [Candidatus Saccharibacteria bacterium]|nr:hypothetical protein [Candidatus Saccharibacteria bacterium]